MGLAPLMLFTTILLIVRNQRILDAWNARQQDNARRAARGLPPKPANAGARPSPPHRPDPRHPATATTPRAQPRPHARDQPAHANSTTANTNRQLNGHRNQLRNDRPPRDNQHETQT